MANEPLTGRLVNAAERVDWKRGFATRGVVRRVADQVAVVTGLPEIRYEELLAFDSGAYGIAFDLREEEVGVVLLAGGAGVREGEGVVGLERLPEVPVGEQVLGRVIDPLGNPLDEGVPITAAERYALFRPAPEIIERRSVEEPLVTGVLAIDAAIPIGRGQRELIIGDRNTGKTALAIDVVAAQQTTDVACVYVLIGQPMSRVQTLKTALEQAGCLHNTVIVAAYAADSPGLQYLAPLAGASVAEWFRDQGRHALVIYDDLTKHADAYRELALLLDRPPGREAYPGDIFYVHAELLERAAALHEDLGGGTVTALPLIETTDGDIAAYIPTNLISITDGQIYLDAVRFERDQRPAIDVGRSVSRIGAVAQPPAVRAVSKRLKIQLSKFEALEKLSRVGLDVDDATRVALDEGNVLRALMRQPRLQPRGIAVQVVWLTALGEHLLRGVEPAAAPEMCEALVRQAEMEVPEIMNALDRGLEPADGWRERLKQVLKRAAADSNQKNRDGVTASQVSESSVASE